SAYFEGTMGAQIVACRGGHQYQKIHFRLGQGVVLPQLGSNISHSAWICYRVGHSHRIVTELDRTLLFDSVRFIGAVDASELISLVVNNENHSNGHQCRWKYKDQNPAAQRLNHSCPRGGSLGVAQRTALREGWYGESEYYQHRTKDQKEPWLFTQPHAFPYHEQFVPHLSSRKLSVHPYCIVNNTKPVKIRTNNTNLRFSVHRCMKNMTANPASTKATASMRANIRQASIF